MLHIFDMFIYTIGWENWEIGNGYMNVLVFIIKIETIPLIGEIVGTKIMIKSNAF